ncbi:hypothetical protein MQE22_06840 [Acidithiobacillus sp. YTS05]|nr:hypothetical protein MQE22_06840 [Acidithiobacillus sp. YTS05]
MPEIVCPHCHTAFQVDESGYAEILRQVRDKEFNKQVETSCLRLYRLVPDKNLRVRGSGGNAMLGVLGARMIFLG